MIFLIYPYGYLLGFAISNTHGLVSPIFLRAQGALRGMMDKSQATYPQPLRLLAFFKMPNYSKNRPSPKASPLVIRTDFEHFLVVLAAGCNTHGL